MRYLPVGGCCLFAAVLVLLLGSGAASQPQTALAASEGPTPASLTAGSAEVHHYEYVFQPGEMFIYDIDHGLALVRHVSGMPDTDGIRGVIVDPSSHRLYISHGGDGGSSGNGALLAYDLASEVLLWNRAYPFGVDSGAITPDGKKIYMPSGENDTSGIWNVLNASDGTPIGSIQGGADAHNTIVSLDGKYAYLAGRNAEYLYVVNTATDQVIQRLGPLNYGVRPFTVNGSNTLAFTTATHFIGYQVSSITTGKLLYTVPVPGFSLPSGYSGPPSHGIALTPDEKQLYVMDAPNDYVHVFDVSGLPSSPPTLIANVKLSPRTGEESPCPYDCDKSGWLQASLDGRFVFAADTGDVIDTQTHAIVNNLAPLIQTRQMLEVDWASGMTSATSTRYGLGHVLGAPNPLTSPAPLPAPGGGAGGGGPAAPTIAGLSISPSTFRAIKAASAIGARRGSTAATVRYQDSEPSRSTFTVLERISGVQSKSHRCVAAPRKRSARARRCWRYLAVGLFRRHDVAGRNRFGFTGSLAGRPLKPGSYRLQVLASAGGRTGVARSVGFRVHA